MRIAMIARVLPRPTYAGGVSGQVHLLASALSRRGHRVTVFASNAPPRDAPYDYRRIPLPDFVARRPRALLYLLPVWVAKLDLSGFDIVHAHGDDHFLRTSVPVVRTFYGSSRAEARHSRRLRQRLYHGSMAVFERRSERRARAVVGISDAMQSDFRRPMIVIPCGYDPTLFSPGGPKTARPAILFVGDLGTRKRADLLLQAFAESVRPAIDGAELWMVTSDPVDRPGVRWLGRLSPDALAAAYREAWVLCLPSRYEGFGVPCVEAMASGTPVVATASGGTEEILENGRWGRLVQDSDVGRALVDVIASQEYRAQLAALGLERAKQYDIARIADQYEALYRGLSP